MRILHNQKWIPLFLSIGIFSILLKQFMPDAHAAKPVEKYLNVGVAEVIEKKAHHWKEFSGRLMAIDHVEIRPRVSSTIESIHFESGTTVKKGALLFTLDPRSFAAEVARKQGELASAEAEVKLANSDYERAQRLIKSKVISPSEFDKIKNAVDIKLSNLKSVKAALDTAKLNLEYTQIKAPIAGKISRPEVTIGNLVEPGPRAILASIVSNNPIYVNFEVDEQTYLQYAQNRSIKSNQMSHIPVKMGLATEHDMPRLGRIESFDNHLNTTSGTIRVRAVFDNSDGLLLPGLFARLKLGSAQLYPSILIADKAISTDQNKKFVLVVDDKNMIHYREVKLGPVIDGLRVVTDGLSSGEKIVISGIQLVRPGQQVTPDMVSMAEKAT